MRYAIFTDVHANLEALEAVLAKIDELAQEEAIDQIWFLGDLVGYGPNPNECIEKLRERTNVIIAGNHDWAAVGKIDLEEFSAAARISAEWTAGQLTEEHQQFLANLPEQLEIGECTLVHGSPYGPLWEYLTSEALAERSFQYFGTRFCLVGHTHVPAIFQQRDTVANTPTLPLEHSQAFSSITATLDATTDASETETDKMVAIQTLKATSLEENGHASSSTSSSLSDSVEITDEEPYAKDALADDLSSGEEKIDTEDDESENALEAVESVSEEPEEAAPLLAEKEQSAPDAQPASKEEEAPSLVSDELQEPDHVETTEEEDIVSSEERLNQEIEELLALLGLSQSLVQVTNEMFAPPEGEWQTPSGYRAIINAGGVGQPRDGDSRAAFMIYDTKRGFTFYRIPYDIEKTQEKIIEVGLPHYLATRLAYGR